MVKKCFTGTLVNKRKLGFTYEDTNSAKAAKNITIPVFVINSKVDQTTPYYMRKDIFENLSSEKKELWTVEDSQHTEIWVDYKEEYRERVKEYLK